MASEFVPEPVELLPEGDWLPPRFPSGEVDGETEAGDETRAGDDWFVEEWFFPAEDAVAVDVLFDFFFLWADL